MAGISIHSLGKKSCSCPRSFNFILSSHRKILRSCQIPLPVSSGQLRHESWNTLACSCGKSSRTNFMFYCCEFILLNLLQLFSWFASDWSCQSLFKSFAPKPLSQTECEKDKEKRKGERGNKLWFPLPWVTKIWPLSQGKENTMKSIFVIWLEVGPDPLNKLMLLSNLAVLFQKLQFSK